MIEKADDVRQGDYRWLTVRVPGESGTTEVSLGQPGLSLPEATASERPVKDMMDRLADVGLGYVSLRQELDTLSAGERQRLKLAIEMSSETEAYVVDEPTTGLHMQDVENLIGLLDRLVKSGKTVIVIEHNLDVVARADSVIDFGPGAGHDGGRVIFEGPMARLVQAEDSVTGVHLLRRLGRSPRPEPSSEC